MTNTSGDVYVVGSVDHEERTGYQLVVVARDLGPESVAASVTVSVRVTDTNDNAPEIGVDTLTGDAGRRPLKVAHQGQHRTGAKCNVYDCRADRRRTTSWLARSTLCAGPRTTSANWRQKTRRRDAKPRD